MFEYQLKVSLGEHGIHYLTFALREHEPIVEFQNQAPGVRISATDIASGPSSGD